VKKDQGIVCSGITNSYKGLPAGKRRRWKSTKKETGGHVRISLKGPLGVSERVPRSSIVQWQVCAARYGGFPALRVLVVSLEGSLPFEEGGAQFRRTLGPKTTYSGVKIYIGGRIFRLSRASCSLKEGKRKQRQEENRVM